MANFVKFLYVEITRLRHCFKVKCCFNYFWNIIKLQNKHKNPNKVKLKQKIMSGKKSAYFEQKRESRRKTIMQFQFGEVMSLEIHGCWDAPVPIQYNPSIKRKQLLLSRDPMKEVVKKSTCFFYCLVPPFQRPCRYRVL